MLGPIRRRTERIGGPGRLRGRNAATESLFSLLQNNGPNRRCRSTREECHYSTVFRIQHSSLKLQQTPAAAIAPRTKPRGARREVVMP